MVSILLAFWIQAWWDEKVECDEFASYLVALEQEFVDARLQIEQNLTASTKINDAANEIFLILADTSDDELPQSLRCKVGYSAEAIHSRVLDVATCLDQKSSKSDAAPGCPQDAPACPQRVLAV